MRHANSSKRSRISNGFVGVQSETPIEEAAAMPIPFGSWAFGSWELDPWELGPWELGVGERASASSLLRGADEPGKVARMAHIPLPEGPAGIRALFAFRPETAQPMADLANILLHAPNSLSPGDRELIASYVSSL